MTDLNNSISAVSGSASTFGDGCSSIYASSMFASAFGDVSDIVKDVETAGEYALQHRIYYIKDSYELNKKTTSKSGLALNFGFFKIGSQSEKTIDIQESSKTIYYLAASRRVGQTTRLQNPKATDEATKIYKESPVTFNQEFGAYYVSGMVRGYYSYVLIEIECSSEQQAEERKKRLDGSVTTDDGSGSASLDSTKGFSELCKEFNAKKFLYTNLTEIPEELQNFSKLDFDDSLKLVDLVAKNDILKAPYIVTEYNNYSPSQFGEGNDKLNDVIESLNFDYNVKKNLPMYQQAVNDLTDAFQRKCDYEESDKISASLAHYEALLNNMNWALDMLDKDIFADVSKYTDAYQKVFDEDSEDYLLTLTANKLLLTKHGSSERIATDALQNLLNPDGNEAETRYNPKFTTRACRQDKKTDRLEKGKSRALVIFSQLEIVTDKNPSPTTKWLHHSFDSKEGGSSDDAWELELRNWMMTNLTPWQYYHCSITTSAAGIDGYKYSVVYPSVE